MKTYQKTSILSIILILFFNLVGCKKYLDEKPNQNQVVPTTLKDAQALLDYNPRMNQSDSGVPEASADNFFITDTRYLAMTESNKRLYTWQKDFIFPEAANDWNTLYSLIYVSNTAIEILNKVDRNSANAFEWDNVRGQSLFYRAHFLFQAASIWCLSFDPNTSSKDLGLPLRLNTNFNEKSIRSSVQKTYEQIISDLKEAISLLPEKQVALTRPSKASALGLLARVYLSMREYELAGATADQCLKINKSLIDYNTLNANATYPIQQFNKEVLFESRILSVQPISNANCFVNQELYNSYSNDDLRKDVFFRKNSNGFYGFKGSYIGSSIYFGGVAVDEIVLIRAECYARQGKLNEAMNDLNFLLVNRYRIDKVTGKTLYRDQIANDKDDAVNKILIERRKELLFRGNRWMDIKRLNKEGKNISLTKRIAEITYQLPANDLRSALPIPEDIISISGIQQNPR